MLYLVDTNILLRFVDSSHHFYPTIRKAIKVLQENEHKFYITSQNCIEFWNVITRPVDRNGFGLTVAEAEQLLAKIEQLFPLLPDSSEIYQEWRRLVIKFGVAGVQVHDARLVASMKVHGIFYILTLNVEDFKRYIPEGIVAVDPRTI